MSGKKIMSYKELKEQNKRESESFEKFLKILSDDYKYGDGKIFDYLAKGIINDCKKSKNYDNLNYYDPITNSKNSYNVNVVHTNTDFCVHLSGNSNDKVGPTMFL
jgi:hypothetical protein